MPTFKKKNSTEDVTDLKNTILIIAGRLSQKKLPLEALAKLLNILDKKIDESLPSTSFNSIVDSCFYRLEKVCTRLFTIKAENETYLNGTN